MKLSDLIEPEKKDRKTSNVNGLSRAEHTKMSKSYFQLANVPARNSQEEKHPAKFPEDLPERFIKAHTFPGDLVFDPFAGTGSTLIAASSQNRKSLGIELSTKWYEIAKYRTRHFENIKLRLADSIQHIKFMKDKGVKIDYTFTSPPYANVLHNTYNGTKRKNKKLPTIFSDSPKDLGNMEYDHFLDVIVPFMQDLYKITNVNKYASFVFQNYLKKDFEKGKRKGNSYLHPLAWEFGIRVSRETEWRLLPETIWLQEKRLLGFGFPKYMYMGNHHQYILHFIKDK